MKRAARHKTGSVVFDKRRKTWNFLRWENGKRRSRVIGTLSGFPTKGAAWGAAQELRDTRTNHSTANTNTPTVKMLVEQYRVERMPPRFSTRHGYNAWLNNHIVPKWGNLPITEVQARPAELWLHSLPLAPKSRAAIRGLLSILWDFAMWRGDIPTQRNPMELVTIKCATKRICQPRSLTVEEFQRFVQHLGEPFRTMALVCVCLGLRISECLALKWADVDWLHGRLRVERGIVRQHVGEVKTAESRKHVSTNRDLLEVLRRWKQTTQFPGLDDWVFASPAKLGRLPWSYPNIWLVFQKAARDAGIGKLGTHTMRHTYRAWLDAVGTPIAVQQRLMRHADIRTTMNVYGDVVTDEMAQASAKVTELVLTSQPA